MVNLSWAGRSPEVVIEISSRPSLEMLRKVSSQPDASTARPSSAPRARRQLPPFSRTPNHLAEGSRIP
jgi:hypothetical protein